LFKDRGRLTPTIGKKVKGGIRERKVVPEEAREMSFPNEWGVVPSKGGER